MSRALPKWTDGILPVDMDGAALLLGVSRRFLVDEIKAHPHYERRGAVYFVKAGNEAKIGFTTNPRGRLHSIQTGCAHPAKMVKVVPGTPAKEREFHRRFAEYRLTGEWFDLRGRLAKYLECDNKPVEFPPRIVKPEPEPESPGVGFL